MASVNKVILIGNLGKDPEIRYTPQGQPVANFSLATTERFGGKDGAPKQERTEWHNIVAFQRLAELAGQYLKKGRSVYIEGRIQTRSWDDKDGNKKYRTEIVANMMQFLGGRDGEGGGGQGGGSSAPRPAQAPRQQDSLNQSAPENFDQTPPPPPSEDDLPF
jgi:single-strand DNA-binding protein